MAAEPFVPPPYPYDRLDELKAVGEPLPGGLVDLSIGTPCDPPPPAVVEALARSGAERGYPPSIGIGRPTARRRRAGWPAGSAWRSTPPAWRRASAPRSSWPAIPQWLRLRRPDLDTVLYPAVSYPTYAMGATLAGVPGGALRRRSTTSTPPTPPGPCASG